MTPERCDRSGWYRPPLTTAEHFYAQGKSHSLCQMWLFSSLLRYVPEPASTCRECARIRLSEIEALAGRQHRLLTAWSRVALAEDLGSEAPAAEDQMLSAALDALTRLSELQDELTTVLEEGCALIDQEGGAAPLNP